MERTQNVNEIRRTVKTFYDIQKLRCQTYKRIVDQTAIDDYLKEHNIVLPPPGERTKKDEEKITKIRSEIIQAMLEKYTVIHEEVDGCQKHVVTQAFLACQNFTVNLHDRASQSN